MNRSTKLFFIIAVGLALVGVGCGKPKEACLIKGNINEKGEKIYHVPNTNPKGNVDAFYDKTQIDESKGERWFCTKEEAQQAGWRAVKN